MNQKKQAMERHGNHTKDRNRFRIRLGVLGTGIVLLFGVLITMIVLECKENEKNYNAFYQSQLSALSREIDLQLNQLLEKGSTEDEILEYFKENSFVSGSRWIFLSRNEKLIFVKDESTTTHLKDRSCGRYITKLKADDAIVSYERIQEGADEWGIGIMTKKDYAMNQAGVLGHTMHVILLVGLFTLVLTGISLYLLLRYLMEGTKNIRLQEQNREANVRLEEVRNEIFSLQYVDPEKNVTEDPEKEMVYDRIFIRKILEDSKNYQLAPMQLMFVDLEMADRYYRKEEIDRITNYLRNFLDKKHLLGEVQKGRFVGVLYKTSPEDALQLQKRLMDYWKEESLPIHISVVEVKDLEKAVEVFEENFQKGNL